MIGSGILNKAYVFYQKLIHKDLKVGMRVRIDYKSKIVIRKGRIQLGDKVVLKSDPEGYHAGMPFPTCLFVDVEDALISIGKNSRVNGAYIHAQKSIIIGENVVIASGVNIIDSNGHKVHSNDRTKGRDIPAEIRIGNNVWIGLNSIVLKGTIIGDNCVVSAGSVVKGVFPENSIIQGNPASIQGQINIVE